MDGERPKATWIHFICLWMTLTTVILSVVFLIWDGRLRDANSKLKDANQSGSELRGKLRSRDADIAALKSIVGYDQTEVGRIGDNNETTVIGRVRADLKKYTGNADQTLREAIARE